MEFIKTGMKINFKSVYLDPVNDTLLIELYPGSIHITQLKEREIRYAGRIMERNCVKRPITEFNPYDATGENDHFLF